VDGDGEVKTGGIINSEAADDRSDVQMRTKASPLGASIGWGLAVGGAALMLLAMLSLPASALAERARPQTTPTPASCLALELEQQADCFATQAAAGESQRQTQPALDPSATAIPGAQVAATPAPTSPPGIALPAANPELILYGLYGLLACGLGAIILIGLALFPHRRRGRVQAGAQPAAELPRPFSQQERDNFQRILAEANGFHLDSLLANRQGRLTSEQGWRLLRAAWRLPVLFGSLGGLFCGLQALFLLDPDFRWANVDYLNVLVWTAASALMASIGWLFLAEMLFDMARGRTSVVEGVGRRHERYVRSRGGRHTSTRIVYQYEIGPEHFEVSRQAYKAFIDGRQYRAHYTPTAKKLVNIEPL
jgi:hypothetical protein